MRDRAVDFVPQITRSASARHSGYRGTPWPKRTNALPCKRVQGSSKFADAADSSARTDVEKPARRWARDSPARLRRAARGALGEHGQGAKGPAGAAFNLAGVSSCRTGLTSPRKLVDHRESRVIIAASSGPLDTACDDLGSMSAATIDIAAARQARLRGGQRPIVLREVVWRKVVSAGLPRGRCDDNQIGALVGRYRNFPARAISPARALLNSARLQGAVAVRCPCTIT